jgi:hypothetical protein
VAELLKPAKNIMLEQDYIQLKCAAAINQCDMLPRRKELDSWNFDIPEPANYEVTEARAYITKCPAGLIEKDRWQSAVFSRLEQLYLWLRNCQAR